jgi:valyl-tRNA synthetase
LITEEIYQTLPQHGDSIMTQAYPEFKPEREAPDAQTRFSSLQELVRAVRTIRSEFTVPPDAKVDVTVLTEAATRENFTSNMRLVSHLAGVRRLDFQDTPPAEQGVIAAAGKGFEVFVRLREAIDAPKEVARLTKERERAESEIGRTREKLANAAFVQRAPKEVVDREQEKLNELAGLIEKIDGYVKALQAQ